MRGFAGATDSDEGGTLQYAATGENLGVRDRIEKDLKSWQAYLAGMGFAMGEQWNCDIFGISLLSPRRVA
jgi:hypothetical protein